MHKSKFFGRLIFLGILLTFSGITPTYAGPMTPTISAYDYNFLSNDGKPLPLSNFRGKVLLIVNTASQCGFTPQYATLESLYETYKSQGLIVLGVPSDDFGGQEPGTDQDIKSFTETKFHISFPLTTKTDVVGDNRHPFYTWAANQNKGGLFGTVPHWNFHKYLVGRHGELLESFGSTTTPDSTTMVEAVQNALKETP